jgi:hypothetical protein
MTTEQTFLLVAQAGVSLSVLLFLAILIIRSREERRKFMLFALRDRLVYLVAVGDLSERSLVFKVFYGALNVSIAEVRDLTLFSVVKASIKVRTAIEREKKERFQEGIARSSPEVQAFANDFFSAMMEIILSSSICLQAVLALAHHSIRVIRFMDRCLGVSWLFGSARQEYDTYRYFEQWASAEQPDFRLAHQH